MYRTRLVGFILLITSLVMLASCGHSKQRSTLQAPDRRAPTATLPPGPNWYLACTGSQLVISSGYTKDKGNPGYDNYVNKLLERPGGNGSAFGIQANKLWTLGLKYQLDDIARQLNPYAVSPPPISQRGTWLIMPTACWIQDDQNRVVAGTRPKIITTTTLSPATVVTADPQVAG